MRLSLILAIAALPAGLHAQSIDFDGTVSLGATDAYASHGVGQIDATVTIPLSQSWPLSFELGTYLFALDGKRPHETYAALVWNDTWRLGAVRPAYDAVLPSVFERNAPYLAYARAEYARAHATTEAMRRTAVPWGLSYTHQAGDLRFWVSAHDAVKGGFRSASVALEWQRGPWTVAAAVEGVWDRASIYDGINAKLGARYDFGDVEIGLGWLHPNASGLPDALALHAAWEVNQRVTLSAFGEFTENGRNDAYGLSARYAIRPDLDVTLAATDGAAGSAFHLTLAHRF
ncbi:hypothetical protein [Tropicibacter alexandrii]|uniref:hypothetical protein n=1 Tax=Tropicibacter alexandrii TaxID=2267683 RepID=UPI000EF43D8A|nr:hypothetical protein [Tropicibacter alexandrii]